VRHAFAFALAIVSNAILFLAMVRMVDARFVRREDAPAKLTLSVVSLREPPPPPARTVPEPEVPEPHREPALAALQLSIAPLPPPPAPDVGDLAVPTATFALRGRPFLGQLAAARERALDPLQPSVRVEPRYPRRALAQGIEGFVVVGFTINRDGTTSNIEVLDSEPPFVFDRSATKAVERWRFAPSDEPRRDSTRFEFELES